MCNTTIYKFLRTTRNAKLKQRSAVRLHNSKSAVNSQEMRICPVSVVFRTTSVKIMSLKNLKRLTLNRLCKSAILFFAETFKRKRLRQARKKMVSIFTSQPLDLSSVNSVNLKISETDNGSPLMVMEDQRLGTFTNWNVPFISKTSLAKDGFYYTGRTDIVKCAYCFIEIGRWEDGDEPNFEHKRWSPNCPFIKGIVHGIGYINSNGIQQGTDTCGYNMEPPSRISEELGLLPSVLSTLGVEVNIRATHTKYALLEKRLESFKDWPTSMKQRPDELAKAGFYYTGVGDQTICFHCGVGLKNWQQSDDVWEEHALWSPKCVFLRLKKGAEFVSKVGKDCHARVTLGVPSTSFSPETSGGSTTETGETSNSLMFSDATSASSDATKAGETKENHKEESRNVPLCGICYDNERSILYLPCRHMFACVDCGVTAIKCPVCRQDVESYMNVFMP